MCVYVLYTYLSILAIFPCIDSLQWYSYKVVEKVRKNTHPLSLLGSILASYRLFLRFAYSMQICRKFMIHQCFELESAIM